MTYRPNGWIDSMLGLEKSMANSYNLSKLAGYDDEVPGQSPEKPYHENEYNADFSAQPRYGKGIETNGTKNESWFYPAKGITQNSKNPNWREQSDKNNLNTQTYQPRFRNN